MYWLPHDWAETDESKQGEDWRLTFLLHILSPLVTFSLSFTSVQTVVAHWLVDAVHPFGKSNAVFGMDRFQPYIYANIICLRSGLELEALFKVRKTSLHHTRCSNSSWLQWFITHLTFHHHHYWCHHLLLPLGCLRGAGNRRLLEVLDSSNGASFDWSMGPQSSSWWRSKSL